MPLTVATPSDNFPYSFLSPEGIPTGFSVDLLDAVARAIHLGIRRVTEPGQAARERFRNGGCDLIQFYSKSPQREAFADFSIPFITLQGEVFINKLGPSIKTLADLNGKPFAVLGSSSTAEQFLIDHNVHARIVIAGSLEEALHWVQTESAPQPSYQNWKRSRFWVETPCPTSRNSWARRATMTSAFASL